MEKQVFIKKVQGLVGEAETEPALDLMLDFLGKESSYLNLYNQTLQAKALFNKTERDESQGIISKEDAKISYNQVTKQILQILNNLNKEEQVGPENDPALRRRMTIGLVLLLLMSGAGFIIYKVWSQPSGNGGPISGTFCPDYNSVDTAFKVLILPFRQRVTGDSTIVDVGIAEDIEERLDVFKVKFKVDIGLGVKKIIEEYPNTTSEADKVARECAANLIIWGAREQSIPGEDIITTRYKFIDIENFSLKQLVLASSSDIDTISSQTSIVTDGQLTEGIEEVLTYIFGIIAHETGNQNAAVAALMEVELEDTSMNITKNMFLADALLQNGQPEEAKEQYTKVLEDKPDYWLARTNRAALNYKDKEYLKAAQDFTIQASEDSSVNVIIGEGVSLFKAGNLEEAKDKLEKVAELDPSLQRIVDTIKVQLQAQEIKKKPDPDNDRIRPKTPEANLPAQQQRRVLTDSELIELIKRDPKEMDNWSNLLRKLYNRKDYEGIRKLAKKAKEFGVEESFYQDPIAEWIKNQRRKEKLQ